MGWQVKNRMTLDSEQLPSVSDYSFISKEDAINSCHLDLFNSQKRCLVEANTKYQFTFLKCKPSKRTHDE